MGGPLQIQSPDPDGQDDGTADGKGKGNVRLDSGEVGWGRRGLVIQIFAPRVRASCEAAIPAIIPKAHPKNGDSPPPLKFLRSVPVPPLTERTAG